MPSNAAKGNRPTSSAQKVMVSGVLLKLLFLSLSTFASDKKMLRKLLKNNLQCCSCRLVPEIENLFDKAKICYSDNRGIHPVLENSTHPVPAEEIKPKDWALKATKKDSRFSEKQKKHPEEKFFSGQETAIKSKQLL